MMASSMLFKIVLISCLALATAKKDKPAAPVAAAAPEAGEAPASGAAGANGVFDVTKFGASVSASASANSKGIVDAFKAACSSKLKQVTVLVPPGTYNVGPVEFVGPCTGVHFDFQFKGTLLAPPDVKAFAKNAWIEFDTLHEITVQGGGIIDGQGAQTWPLTCTKPIAMRFTKCITGKITDLTLKNSKFFNIALHNCQAMDLSKLKIIAPYNSKNTDGVHMSSSKSVTLTDLDIGVGDDCISIGPGSFNVTVKGCKCGPGHGISIGSLGKYRNEENVGQIHVKDCTITGTTNGLRIKTWPGAPPSEAAGITFEDVTLTNVSYPIIIDQEYCPNKKCTTHEPSNVKLKDITFCRIKGTSNTPIAVKLKCSSKAQCQGIKLEDINLTPYAASVKEVKTLCTNVVGAALGTQNPDPCLGEKLGPCSTAAPAAAAVDAPPAGDAQEEPVIAAAAY